MTKCIILEEALKAMNREDVKLRNKEIDYEQFAYAIGFELTKARVEIHKLEHPDKFKVD